MNDNKGGDKPRSKSATRKSCSIRVTQDTCRDSKVFAQVHEQRGTLAGLQSCVHPPDPRHRTWLFNTFNGARAHYRPLVNPSMNVPVGTYLQVYRSLLLVCDVGTGDGFTCSLQLLWRFRDFECGSDTSSYNKQCSA